MQLSLFDEAYHTVDTLAITSEVEAALRSGAAVAFSVSGGKDGSAAAAATLHYLDCIGHAGPRLLIHSDLGRVEWAQSLLPGSPRSNGGKCRRPSAGRCCGRWPSPACPGTCSTQRAGPLPYPRWPKQHCLPACGATWPALWASYTEPEEIIRRYQELMKGD